MRVIFIEHRPPVQLAYLAESNEARTSAASCGHSNYSRVQCFRQQADCAGGTWKPEAWNLIIKRNQRWRNRFARIVQKLRRLILSAAVSRVRQCPLAIDVQLPTCRAIVEICESRWAALPRCAWSIRSRPRDNIFVRLIGGTIWENVAMNG